MLAFSALHLYGCLLILAILGTSPTLAHRHGNHRTHHGDSSNQRASRHHAHHYVNCVDPPNLEQRLHETNADLLHDTFYMIPSFRELVENQTRQYSFLPPNISLARAFDRSPECFATRVPEFWSDPCPIGNSRFNFDPNRYPRLLLESRCGCRNCRGITDTTYNGYSPIPRCQGVFYFVHVLRRTGCEAGVYQYQPTLERIQIGCACKLDAMLSIVRSPIRIHRPHL